MQVNSVLESQNVANLREAGLRLTRAILANDKDTRGEGPNGKVAEEALEKHRLETVATDTASAAVHVLCDQVLVPACMQHSLQWIVQVTNK
jgi:hypothetical protein